ncbi:ATP-binding protein [Noviluteimonas gilva]|uniref:ATP-binding protein n=1 Tax=Noviluteimonas gilva TaxID=2682097 RepID=A0A7C9HTM3_9GAMM|nr:ATP-binding protein [Lysobacter gilvus]MUV12978.1 ATP-binding protein [Lysobacter gilvus]
MPSVKRQTVLSWSGGKDAAWALHALRSAGEVDVVALVTTVTSGYDRIAMHGIRRDLLQAQARAAGLPVIEAVIPPQCDNATYEASFAAALSEARTRWPACEDIAFGDLFLEDVKAWREALCARLRWTPRFPLFGRDTATLAREMIEGGLRAHLCCVDTQQLDATFSGRAFDARLLADLPASCDPCGERGEFHTLVHAGPMFAQPIAVERGESVLRDARFAYTDFNAAA